MKRSLYVRTVGTYIGAVLVSLIASYVAASLFFHKEVIFEEEVARITSRIANVVEMTDAGNIDELVRIFHDFNMNILLIGSDGAVHPSTQPLFAVPEAYIQQVLDSPEAAPVIFPYTQREPSRLVGIPIQLEQADYAFFLNLNFEHELGLMKRITLLVLILVLMFGSLLILLASRQLVKPIRKLTLAAQQMASGNFSVRLRSKNKDEIGELMTAFNHMASELGQIDKMRDDFVSNVSHEIQSPLTSVKGFTKALRDGIIPKDNEKEILDIIYQETDRLSRLGDNLLQLASLDSEHHPYHPVKFRLDEQIRRAVLVTEPQWKPKQLQIQLELEPALIYADRDLFEQVWLNLITNAIKYSEPQGTIGIRLHGTPDHIEVRIADNGQGIPKVSMPYLFDRFYTADKSRSRAAGGNGLGLSIVKRILTLHHGSIAIESEEGKGTEATVKIPKPVS